MIRLAGQNRLALVGILLSADLVTLASDSPIESSYFEGRWALAGDSCDSSSNWTLISGGIFVSENLTGNWEWGGERLVLNLTDLAIDEETGEAGGRFQMEGPVEVLGANAFRLEIEPDVYEIKRCAQSEVK